MSNTQYRAVFFDLDGTLLPMDIDRFMQSYFNALGAFVASKGLDAKQFFDALRAGTQAMTSDDSALTNSEVFWNAFFKRVPQNSETWYPLLDDFYENHFGALGSEVVANPSAAQALEALKAKGYPLYLTTMPLFPLRAVIWRCQWAGIDWRLFDRITHYENSSSVKPKLAYFEENLATGGFKPAEVLMVGNNTHDDLSCLELSMDAYLVTDFLLNPNNFDLASVRSGSLDDFAQWVHELAPCATQ